MSASNSFNPLSALLPILMGGAGYLGSTGTTNTTGSQTTSGTTSGTSSGSTSPVLSAEQQMISNAYGNALMNQYNQGVNLAPYQAAGDQSINQQGNANAANIANSLASRGLSYSPAAGTAITQNRLNTVNQENQFNESIPLLQQQINQGNIQQMISGFSALPTGSTTTGTTSGTTSSNTQSQQTQTKSTNPLAGLLSGVGSGLGLLLGAF